MLATQLHIMLVTLAYRTNLEVVVAEVLRAVVEVGKYMGKRMGKYMCKGMHKDTGMGRRRHIRRDKVRRWLH